MRIKFWPHATVAAPIGMVEKFRFGETPGHVAMLGKGVSTYELDT
jgi:hypothetical protein